MKTIKKQTMRQVQGGSWVVAARLGLAAYGADMIGAGMTAMAVSGFGAILAGGLVAIVGTCLGWDEDEIKTS